MFTTMKKVLAAGALMLAAVVSIPTSAAAQNATFTVFNHSSYRINHMYVSSTNNNYWESTGWVTTFSIRTIALIWPSAMARTT